MGIIKHRRIWYCISGLLVAASLVALMMWGLRLGIDFTGGSFIELEFQGVRPSVDELTSALRGLNIGEPKIQPAGESQVFIRMKDIDESTHQAILQALTGSFSDGIVEKRFNSIGPVIGRELKQKSLTALIVVFIGIVLYIAWAFRKVSHPVSSWKYGITALIALAHDALIPMGVFAFLGKFYGVEIESLFVAALLTVIGFSVHDTIVVFDRIRENLKLSAGREPFEETIGRSINQTIARSINTSLTTVLVMLALFFLGGASTKFFALAFLIGVTLGTYSSIFIASPLLLAWRKKQSI